MAVIKELQQWHSSLNHTQGPDPLREAQVDLATIAFFYLLRVGEYTRPRNSRTNTVPFSVEDITFRRQGRLIPITASTTLTQLYQADEATIRMPNQKNGHKGECITQNAHHHQHCPIKALARRVHHIMSHGGTHSTKIFNVRTPMFTLWQHVKADQISTLLKWAAGEHGLYTRGYTPEDVSSHSLRAGGAMALFLNGASTITIRKMGRWRSDTFLMYIHEQISAFNAGLSVKMCREIAFHHIAGPRVTPHTPRAA